MSIITVNVGSYTYDETQIILNPTISKSICSGGFSVGNTACGCLKVGVPNNGHSEGDSVKISYNGNQIMGEFFISDIEKCGYAKLNPTDVYKTQMVMLTCYDGMSKLDDYMTFSGTVTPADICNGIESKTGYLFEDGSKLGALFDITKEEAESRTMREWLGIFGCYVGCNWTLRSYRLNDVLVGRITQLPLYYSGYSFSAIINSPVTVENAVTFSRVVSRGKDGTFKSGTDSDYTLEISFQYATQSSNDTILNNISSSSYTAFKCDKLKTEYLSMDIGDEITLSGHSGGLKIYNQMVTITINGIYMSVGADTQKKTLNEDINYSSGGGTTLENVSNFQGGTSGNTGIVNLTWVKPSSAQNVIVKRKRSTPFNNVLDDGEIIAVTSGETLADTMPSLWYSYYYRTLTNAGDLYNGKDNQIMIPAVSRGKYLYNAGDLCTAITGGWNNKEWSGFVAATSGWCMTQQNLSFESTYINLAGYNPDTTYNRRIGGGTSTNTVDFTGFTKVCMEFEIVNYKKYAKADTVGDGWANNNSMPSYNLADVGISGDTYKYRMATCRAKNFPGDLYPYDVIALKYKPVYMENMIDTDKIKLSAHNQYSDDNFYIITYNGNQSYHHYVSSYSIDKLLVQPNESPDTTYGDYMGGGYTDGWQWTYAMDFTPDNVPHDRVWLAVHDGDNVYANALSKVVAQWDNYAVGTYTIECSIPNGLAQAYIGFGGFESDVKINAIWLAE